MRESDLEQRILEAARELFMEQGVAATTTTDIAHRAGCTQALVHYYYRTKEKLFYEVFRQNLQMLLQSAEEAKSSGNLMTDISNIIDAYFAFLNNHRHLPYFVLSELLPDANRRQFIKETVIQNTQRIKIYLQFQNIVYKAIEEGVIRQIEPIDLLLDVVSLVVMTFSTLPIYMDLLDKTPEEIDRHIERRKEEIKILIINGLRP